MREAFMLYESDKPMNIVVTYTNTEPQMMVVEKKRSVIDEDENSANWKFTDLKKCWLTLWA